MFRSFFAVDGDLRGEEAFVNILVKVMMQPLIDFYPLSLPPFSSYSSGLTQQLFLVVNGVLSSAYPTTLCPTPILKWLFQVSLCYSCSCNNSVHV